MPRRWTATGTTGPARARFTLTTLAGRTALAAGGCQDLCCQDLCCQGVTAAAETRDPGTGTWTTTGSLRRARRHQAAAVLPTGWVLVTGGQDASVATGGATATAETCTP